MSNDYEKLFLIEILVNSVNISTDKLNLDPSVKSRLGETCVMFQFLNYQPLVICEGDMIKTQSQQSRINFSHGKSCLFSIRSSVCPTLPANLDVIVKVLQKVNSPEGNQQMTIGNATIPMGDSFTSLIRTREVNKDNEPATRTKTGTYALLDNASNQIGDIAVFVRLSCFGPMIVTQIQFGGDDKSSFLFKGTEHKNVYEFPGDETKKPVPMIDETKQQALQNVQQWPQPAQELSQAQQQQSPYPGPSEQYMGEMDQFQPYDDPSCEVMDRYYDQPPLSDGTSSKRGNYKEIVAEIRGHALKIRVPRKNKKKGDEEDRPYLTCSQLQELQKELQKDSRPASRCQCACMRQ